MAPAPLDDLSPAGSSTYESNTLYVGDGTWDSTKNDFLLPNLVGFNFETMRYNGMGNRFASMTGYHSLILAHGVIAVITFLFIVPAAIMIARFYGHAPGAALRYHIYLNVLTIFLSTVVFILGWFAVGPARSLTNPHHGIGLAIYVMILVQAIFGSWVRGRLRSRVQRRLPMKLMFHQWLGRTIALLGIAQVALGLTLYGSPKFTFVLYALWMTFLLLLYFILSYRAGGVLDTTLRYGGGGGGGTVIEERKSGGIMQYLAPLAAGGLAAAVLGRNRHEDEREEVIPSRRGSRRGSGSYIEEEKYEERRDHGGITDKLLAAAGILGAGALAKSYFDRRRERREEDEYSAVDPDTPSRRPHRARYDDESEISESTVPPPRRPIMDRRRQTGLLPGPGDPVAAAAAMSAAEPRPVTPRPVGRPAGHNRSRRDSYDSYSSIASPSRRPERNESHNVRNGLLGGLGLAWLGKRYKDRKDRKEQQRLEDLRAKEIEDEKRLESERRHGSQPPRFTADGHSNRYRRDDITEMTDSDMTTTDFTDSALGPPRRGGGPPPRGSGLLGGAGGGAAATATLRPQSSSQHDVIGETVPPPPPFSHRASQSALGQPESVSTRRGREEEAAAAAVASAAGLAAEEERRRQREQDRSRSRHEAVASPVSLHLTQHNDANKNITLRRLTEEEAAAERASRRQQRRRADSASSVSASETAQSRRRYRRDESARRAAADEAADKHVESGMAPLSPPRPAFAGGRSAKDSSYYSGTPARPTESVTSPESHGTWSALSPGTHTEEDPAERRRRRRAERQRQGETGTVDFQ